MPKLSSRGQVPTEVRSRQKMSCWSVTPGLVPGARAQRGMLKIQKVTHKVQQISCLFIESTLSRTLKHEMGKLVKDVVDGRAMR